MRLPAAIARVNFDPACFDLSRPTPGFVGQHGYHGRRHINRHVAQSISMRGRESHGKAIALENTIQDGAWPRFSRGILKNKGERWDIGEGKRPRADRFWALIAQSHGEDISAGLPEE